VVLVQRQFQPVQEQFLVVVVLGRLQEQQTPARQTFKVLMAITVLEQMTAAAVVVLLASAVMALPAQVATLVLVLMSALSSAVQLPTKAVVVAGLVQLLAVLHQQAVQQEAQGLTTLAQQTAETGQAVAETPSALTAVQELFM
jgi:hypothetical protein